MIPLSDKKRVLKGTFFSPITIYYCYDPFDLAFCEALDLHLAPLKQMGRIQTWGDWQILAGQERNQECEQHLSSDRVLVLLLSPSFLASEASQHQIRIALDRHQRGEAVVLPVLIRPCLWRETELAKFQMLPHEQKAVSVQTHPEILWQEIVTDIGRVIESLRQWVFIACSPEDQPFVQHLCSDLTVPDIEVVSLGHGLSEDDFIQNSSNARDIIRKSSFVIFVASPDAPGSYLLKAQRDLVVDYQRPFIVMWARGETWNASDFGDWHSEEVLDMRGERYEDAKKALLARIKKQTVSALPALNSLSPTMEPRNPYKGLKMFTEEDASDFFGREALLDELMGTLQNILIRERSESQSSRLLAVLGASGSGKSSVIRAGLLPVLKQGKISESQEWIYLDPITPKTHPLEELAATFAQQKILGDIVSLQNAFTSDSIRTLHLFARQLAGSSHRKAVLFIDQFEEVFTLTESEEERRHFLDLLVAAVTEPEGPLLVILTLRADFYDHPMRYPAFYHLLDVHHVSLLPIERKDLRRVIELPAQLPDVQVTFEAHLVGDLLFDMYEQSGALPLLQFTLESLFERRRGHLLTLQAYEEIGGVKGALAQHAEACYASLSSEEHRKLACSLFLRLINPGATEQEATRRRAELTELSLPDASQTVILQETANDFIKKRLLTTNGNMNTATLEVSHEALIREWPRLREWLREARDDIHLQQTLSKDASEWQIRRQPKDRLYRGTQLKEARAWARRNTPSKEEATFLHASLFQRVRVFISILSMVFLLLSTTGGAIWFAFHSQPDPTLVTTTTDGDSVVGSLRWAIDNAPSGSTITFKPDLWGHTFTLTADLVITTKKLAIRGPGALTTFALNRHQFDIRSSSSVNISNMTLVGSKGYNGVSLVKNEGTLVLMNCSIENNMVTGSGGGIYNEGKLTLTDSFVSGNKTLGVGGGIYGTGGGTLTIINSEISNNTSGAGGGIYAYDSNVNIMNSAILHNEASTDGGGIYNTAAWVTLKNSTVAFNEANTDRMSGLTGGGGIYTNAPLTVINSTISDNHVQDPDKQFLSKNDSSGGGILSFDLNSVSILFSTIYNNRAYKGAGIEVRHDPDVKTPQSLMLRNSLIAGNSYGFAYGGRPAPGQDIEGNFISGGYNIIQNTSGITLNAQTKQSTDIFGGTLAGLKIDLTLQYPTYTNALLPGSPAIDVIPLQNCLIEGITTDERGVKRPQGKACDIGAYEYKP